MRALFTCFFNLNKEKSTWVMILLGWPTSKRFCLSRSTAHPNPTEVIHLSNGVYKCWPGTELVKIYHGVPVKGAIKERPHGSEPPVARILQYP